MKSRPALLVFSDLDGTLLDHADYSWDAALPALEALKARKAGVILATSKTAAEVIPLRSALGLSDWPAIVENGGGLLEADGDAIATCDRYPEILHKIEALPEGFTGFAQMSVDEIVALTGLSPADAAQAKDRRFTEPGIWTGPQDQLSPFLEQAKSAGLHARRGGRFLTLSFGSTKADLMQTLVSRFEPQVSIALGDAPNDIEMLQQADFGVIVANSAGAQMPQLPGEADRRIIRTRAEGPAGWNEAILALLQELPIPEGH